MSSSSIVPIAPASSKAGPYVKATLAIPEKAVRVIAAPPDTLTQRNVEAATGIPSRVYLTLIRSPDFDVPVRKLGKLRVVNRLAFLAWLERDGNGLEAMPPSVPMNDNRTSIAPGPPSSHLGSLLDRVGLERRREPPRRRRAGGRRR